MKASYFILPVIGSIASLAVAETHVVDQKDKAFSIEKIDIKVGDKVNFVNQDPFFHNVFSLSDAKFFDLGSYPQGEGREVEFDQPGVIEVECAIHPSMKLIIDVK